MDNTLAGGDTFSVLSLNLNDIPLAEELSEQSETHLKNPPFILPHKHRRTQIAEEYKERTREKEILAEHLANTILRGRGKTAVASRVSVGGGGVAESPR